MPRLTQWEHQIGHRLRLRDLFVFFTVVEYGSMAKAGAKLGVSTPSISEVISALEHALGVRLRLSMKNFAHGRFPRPNILRWRRRRVRFMVIARVTGRDGGSADPRVGELRIGCPESIAAEFLVAVLERFAKEYPRVRFHILPVHQPTVEFPELSERKVDMVFARLSNDPVQGRLTEELDAEVLFND